MGQLSSPRFTASGDPSTSRTSKVCALWSKFFYHIARIGILQLGANVSAAGRSFTHCQVAALNHPGFLGDL